MTGKRRAQYICFEGTEGVGKTTQVQKLVEYLSQTNKVLQTKEPGTPLLPITLQLRSLVLDNKFDPYLSQTSRELINQASRSIHLEYLIKPNLYKTDYIVQDRGVLSSLSYGKACKNKSKFLKSLSDSVVINSGIAKKYHQLYDHVIILKGNPKNNLKRAKQAKKEFKKGDAMESKGDKFIAKVEQYMTKYSKKFKKTTIIQVDGLSIDEVFELIKKALNI
jgi:dTMP kinase